MLSALPAAHAKDGGVEPGTLAWVLSTVPLDTSELLLEVAIDEQALGAFRDDLVARLQRMAFTAARTPG